MTLQYHVFLSLVIFSTGQYNHSSGWIQNELNVTKAFGKYNNTHDTGVWHVYMSLKVFYKIRTQIHSSLLVDDVEHKHLNMLSRHLFMFVFFWYNKN